MIPISQFLIPGTSRALRSTARALLPFAFTSALFAAAPPATPGFLEPEEDHAIVNGADVHMVTTPFSDPDGDAHRCTDWEIRTVGNDIAWSAPCVTNDATKIHIHFGDGAFAPEFALEHALHSDTFYLLRARHRDDSGDAATEWSEWGSRIFKTGPRKRAQPMRVRDVLAAPAPSWSITPPAGVTLRLELAESGTIVLDTSNRMLADGEAGVKNEAVLVTLHATSAQSLPRSELTFENESGRRHTIYLPAAELAAGETIHYAVSGNGGTHRVTTAHNEQPFAHVVRGAPVPWTVWRKGYVVEHVAGGLRLPVNIAFVPNPGSAAGDPFFYVVELYGDVKLVTRDGTVHDFATGLLNFDPFAVFPGSGELGVAGVAVDAANGDVYVTRVKSLDGSAELLVPEVIRLKPSADGMRAAAVESVLLLENERQVASHQISNVTIGPDRKLYVHFGDVVQHELAQDLSTVLGKIIRVEMDGGVPSDNPFYDAADGITAADRIYARGFRNPFGGAWRAADQSLDEVENGPDTDRLAKVVAGGNYGWDGTNESMRTHAITTWKSPAAPVQIAFVQPETFGGSGFPSPQMGSAFVTLSGATWASGPQDSGKIIDEVKSAGAELSSETHVFAEYDGTGKASVSGIAAGPDGLYFTDLYKDHGYETPVDRGANVFRIRWTGYADFTARSASANGLTVDFVDRSRAEAATSWTWDFGDGTSSSEPSPRHAYDVPGTYIVRLSVGSANGTLTETKKIRVSAPGDDDVVYAEYFARPDFTALRETRDERAISFDFGHAEPFSAYWNTTLRPRVSERYTFTVATNGVARVTLDGEVIVDRNREQGAIDLEAGREYELEVEYQHLEAGPASIRVEWHGDTRGTFVVPLTTTPPRRPGVRR